MAETGGQYQMYHRTIDQRMAELIDPKTGLPLVPLYVRADGSCVWPVMGAAPDDEDGDEEESEEEESEEEGEDEEGEEEDEPEAKSKKKKKDPDPRDVKLAQLERRMKAADRRASKAEKELQELKGKDKNEEDKSSEELATLRKQNEELQAKLSSESMTNAFLKINSFRWANPSTAMVIAQQEGYLDEVRDEETGKIDKDALKLALKTLAKEHSYLVKAKEDEDDEDDEDKSKKSLPKGASGTPVGSGRKKKKQDFDPEELRRKYPALNR